MDILAVATSAAAEAVALNVEGETPGLTINLFWVIVSGLNLLIFLALVWTFAFKPLARTMEERRDAIEQGLRDAEQARRDREGAEAERVATLNEARREANEILNRAQKVAQETREADMAATREELERLRARATTEIEAEKQRAMTEIRSEVADLALAAASRVVGESLTDARQRRLVEEFLEGSAVTTDGRGR
jgi:F-type H+-transporting ATPase subunit b